MNFTTNYLLFIKYLNLFITFTLNISMIVCQFAAKILIIIKKILGLVLLLFFKTLEIFIILCEISKEFIVIIHTFLYADEHMHKIAQYKAIRLDTSISNGLIVSHVSDVD